MRNFMKNFLRRICSIPQLSGEQKLRSENEQKAYASSRNKLDKESQ
jgi:hypothetical protein